jgi:hypothetical protein
MPYVLAKYWERRATQAAQSFDLTLTPDYTSNRSDCNHLSNGNHARNLVGLSI